MAAVELAFVDEMGPTKIVYSAKEILTELAENLGRSDATALLDKVDMPEVHELASFLMKARRLNAIFKRAIQDASFRPENRVELDYGESKT